MKRLLLVSILLITLINNNISQVIYNSIDYSIYGIRLSLGYSHQLNNHILDGYVNSSITANHKEIGVRYGYALIDTDALRFAPKIMLNKQFYKNKSSYHLRPGLEFVWWNNLQLGLYVDNVIPYVEFGYRFKLGKN